MDNENKLKLLKDLDACLRNMDSECEGLSPELIESAGQTSQRLQNVINEELEQTERDAQVQACLDDDFPECLGNNLEKLADSLRDNLQSGLFAKVNETDRSSWLVKMDQLFFKTLNLIRCSSFEPDAAPAHSEVLDVLRSMLINDIWETGKLKDSLQKILDALQTIQRQPSKTFKTLREYVKVRTILAKEGANKYLADPSVPAAGFLLLFRYYWRNLERPEMDSAILEELCFIEDIDKHRPDIAEENCFYEDVVYSYLWYRVACRKYSGLLSIYQDVLRKGSLRCPVCLDRDCLAHILFRQSSGNFFLLLGGLSDDSLITVTNSNISTIQTRCLDLYLGLLDVYHLSDPKKMDGLGSNLYDQFCAFCDADTPGLAEITVLNIDVDRSQIELDEHVFVDRSPEMPVLSVINQGSIVSQYARKQAFGHGIPGGEASLSQYQAKLVLAAKGGC